MRKRSAFLGIACAVGFALAASIAWAEHSVVTNVPFAFTVDGNKTLPAGRYEITAKDPDEAPLTIRSLSSGKEHAMMVLTRIAQVGTSDAVVVFDKAEDGTCYLSEVHMPGIDGFAFQGAPGKHSHVKVTGKP